MTVLHIIDYNIFQTLDFSPFRFNDKHFKKLLMLPTSTKNVNMMICISIRMIKLCSKSVLKPLSVTFKNCIDTGKFPDVWKRSNVINFHNKDDK